MTAGACVGRLLGLALVIITATGCLPPGSNDEDTVLVFAASSLTSVFEEMEQQFEAANQDLDIRLNVGSSASLREQILEGAPADVFVSANESNMRQVETSEGLAAPSRVVARNRLVIAVPPDNPAGVDSLADFGNDALLMGLCDPSVPCGDFARQTLVKAAVTPRIDTNESSARSLLAKIEAGELDAGIVYATDALASGDATTAIAIPDHFNVSAEYPIAILAEAPNVDGGRRFVDFVSSPAGERIFADQGFEPVVEGGAGSS